MDPPPPPPLFHPHPQPFITTVPTTTFASPTTAFAAPTATFAAPTATFVPPTATFAPPTTTLTATEAQINNSTTTHVAANPTPTPNPTFNHPPYAEMIYAAIAALKERDGSSKRAIAKYIERAYSGLPPTHSALLTHHLKRLKNSGLLVMVKKSYKLPRSDDVSSLPPPPPPPTADTTSLLSPGPTRGRGRPPKPKPIPDNSIIPQQPTLQPLQQQQPIAHPNFQPFPPLTVQPNSQPNPQPNSQPMFVALGLVDEPASEKKRPGRPRKGLAVGIGQGGPVSAKRGRGRPPGSRLPKKRPGRPPKPKSVSAVLGPNGHVKRGRGRPSKAEPKTVFIPYATNVPIMGEFEQNSVPNVVVPQSTTPRPRGRPKKDAAAAAGVGGIVSGKRRGRPPQLPGVERPRKSSSTGRPVGRPKKNVMETAEAPDPQFVANGEFKSKLEFFQIRVGQAVGALKPYLNNESAVNVIAAIQELEALATMDISAPLNIEAQQPVLQS